MDARVHVFPAAELAERAAEELVRIAERAIGERGVFHLALAGGGTPRALYARLAEGGVDLSRWHLWFGDERHVPLDHPDSNYRMVRESLLEPAAFPAERTHPFPTHLAPGDAARAYARELGEHLEIHGGLPRFDLVLLGMGTDGHTASLFPGDPRWRDDSEWVAAAELSDSAHGVQHGRLTLTLPVLTAAREVLFLVAGASKAERLAEVLAGAEGLPAAAVARRAGRLSFFVDEAAAP